MGPPDDMLAGVEQLLGARPVAWQRATGGYSVAERWSLDLDDGRRVFAKLAPTEDLAWRLRDEHRNMTAIHADFRCEVLGWMDGERPLLVLEDVPAHATAAGVPAKIVRQRQTTALAA